MRNLETTVQAKCLIIGVVLFLVAPLSEAMAKQAVDPTTSSSAPSSVSGNIDYVDSARFVINEIWVRHADRSGFEKQFLSQPREIVFVPSSEDFAEVLVDLDLPTGAYDQVRLVMEAGTVVLTDHARVRDGKIFSTELGNLKIPSAAQVGHKENIEPPIEVVTQLSDELILVFDLARSFVFNGSPARGRGVKKVLFKPVVRAMNDSTHGRVSLRVIQRVGASCQSQIEPLADVSVTAIDQSGAEQSVTTTTDANGEAWIALLPGTYDILIEAVGYAATTVRNNDVYIANETALGDVAIKMDGTETAFDRDRAILLMLMAEIAYKEGLGNKEKGDKIPRTKNDYTEQLKTGFSEYLDPCWKFYHFISEQGNVHDTEALIATNDDTEDIVVSFAGSEKGDGWTDLLAFRGPWLVRAGPYAGVVLPAAVNFSIKTAYDLVRDELEGRLRAAIAEKVTNESTAHVYFTGHSLGGMLATLAALDLADILVEEGYDRNNVVMYSYAAPRTITETLSLFATRGAGYIDFVPNSFAVGAKDDPGPHAPPREFGRIPDWTHIPNLVVLSTNIHDRNPDSTGERYAQIGDTRTEMLEEKIASSTFTGCSIPASVNPSNLPSRVPPLINPKLGHDQLQYIKRLENIVDGGIPRISIGTFDTTPHLPGGELLELAWNGGVQGPCDFVGLYQTALDPLGIIPNPKKGDLAIGTLRRSRRFVVNGAGYPKDGSDLGPSRHVTPVFASEALLFDLWVGYVDGNGRFLSDPVKFRD